ncbi:MAG: cysteine--tRNA ligase [Candidatus Micrarchaeales archaeon]|jgi:cysteinyl-tRNA synthetase|uniref:Cysteine--tRNA ligase n=1 Tax=Candidatus Micrarchaeum acidiphilum ARMAN-2 TaxID=425595 RepID=C7DIM1_MICA2|nr:MAG: cysteinyl-tRNA synthetase [Candidatus Micrarchaeum acidiphilum ARMAN-2]MCW6161050.1 cysteine--tRNA ligase [Candidatus Micrarchaeales archaeon]
MKLHIYNTLSRSVEEFKPRLEGKVDMFVCGQTPYDDAHLGHARNYIVFDVVVRWLRHLGYDVRYIQNITDIEDKIINRAKERGITAEELERYYEKRFLEDMEAIGVKKNVTQYLRSHDYIDTMVMQIQMLLDGGYAYQIDSDIYYDVDKFVDYTKLSGMKLEQLKEHRIEPREGKRNVYDFALWKGSKPGEPSWKIKLRIGGNEIEFVGRPGWHIEDTAMTYAVFGPQYDIHGGASELIFPHHSNEIAQAEAAFGKVPFVRYWMHAGVLNVNNIKMSKSLKNFITIREILGKYDAEALRLLMVSTHYRKEINYTERLIKEAQEKLDYMYNSMGVLYNAKEGNDAEGNDLAEKAVKLDSRFEELMNADFNTSVAVMELFGAFSDIRSYFESNRSIGHSNKETVYKSLLKCAGALGLLESDAYKTGLEDEAMELIKTREKLRVQKKFEDADRIRQELLEKYGLALEDTEYGTIWFKKRSRDKVD